MVWFSTRSGIVCKQGSRDFTQRSQENVAPLLLLILIFILISLKQGS